MKKVLNKIFSIFNHKSKWVAVFLPIFILGVFFFFITMNNVYSQTYDVERFDRAKETIRSPITMENEVETERKMRETVLSVGDRYTILEEITEEQLNYLNEIFDAVDTLTNEPKVKKGKNDKEDEEPVEQLTYEEIVYQLQEILSSEITDKVDDIVFMHLIQLEEKERTHGKEVFLKATKKVLNSGVRIENIQGAKEEVSSVIKYSTLQADVKETLEELIDFAIVENSFFDVEKTMEARKEAASNVEPVIIRSGDIIVREGQIITNEIFEDLKLVGLLNKQKSIYPGIGLTVFIIMIVGLIGYELNRLYRREELDKGKISAVILISIILIALMKIVSLYTDQLNQLYLLVPIATGVMLLKILIYERISIVFSIVYSILGSIIFNGEIPGTLNVEAGLYFFFFQMAGIVFLTNIKDRGTIIRAAFGMAIINIMTISMYILLSFEKFELVSLLIHSAFGIGAAVLSAVLTIGLLPFFETGLGILSDGKLLALANPNQPLLRKLLTEAPGTYHHSVMVANLSESACEAIGANGLLARVGSYYHDIGKTQKPHYFIENQVAIRNPHDFIEPKKSAEIIISHATEGANMLKEHKLPKEIIDIAMQHHGTSLVSYFYHKAKETDEEVKEEDFRYPGPKPSTREGAIISICDSAEAAVRSLKEPSPERIEEIVSSIVNNKLMDGQLDDTPITIEELHIIRETVCEALKGIFHSRIQYPTKEAN
ncbi:HDIG domain-containing protein [Pseudogracilibacillus sp. SE30717A]|uniref:HD family phosphohydrolase n=1 Tax=Pseudogracilibacillus sp. SE30717A TaxID=3098293 RepID=UPI00300DCA51